MDKRIIVLVIASSLLCGICANPMYMTRVTSPLELMSIMEIEEPCVQQGGTCVLTQSCPQGNLVQMRGKLCPSQRHLGVECCYL